MNILMEGMRLGKLNRLLILKRKGAKNLCPHGIVDLWRNLSIAHCLISH